MSFNLNPTNDKDFDYYKNQVFSNLVLMDDDNSYKEEIARDIALYMCMFDYPKINPDTLKSLKKEYFEAQVLPLCRTFTGVSDREFSDGRPTCGLFNLSDTNGPKCDIILSPKEEIYKGHCLSHELGHFLSIDMKNSKEFESWELMTKCKAIEEMFTEYYANCLTSLKEIPGDEYLDSLNSFSVYPDDFDSVYPEIEVIAHRAFYSQIEGFAPILDTVLHDEILGSKIFKDHSIVPYIEPLEKVNKDAFSLLNDGFNYDSFLKMNESLEDCLEMIILKKYEKAPLEDTINDYFNLRESLKTFGVPILQEGIIRNLDGLMAERLVGKHIEEIDDYTVSKIFEAFDNEGVINSTNRFNTFKKILDDNWIEITDNGFIIDKKDCLSIDEIFSMDNHSLIKTEVADSYSNLLKKMKIGLNIERTSILSFVTAYEDSIEDIKNVFLQGSFKGNIDFYESVTDIRDINKDIFEKIFLKGDLFKKGLETSNIRLCSDILYGISKLEPSEREDFFKNFKEDIKNNTSNFFNSLLYTSSYKRDSEATSLLIESLASIDFNDIKDSKDRNFLSFCESKCFTCSGGALGVNQDLVLGYVEYDVKNEQRILKSLLSNGFSLEDRDYLGRTAFSVFMQKRSFKTDHNTELLNTMKEISKSMGNYNKLIKSLPEDIKEKYKDILEIDTTVVSNSLEK